MRRLTILVAFLAALYSGYWFVGASATERGVAGALTAIEGSGWQVKYAGLNTAGFPSRFDTTLTDLSVQSPDGSVAWSAPFVQALSLSYQPNRVIAAFPPTQDVSLGGVSFQVASDTLRASAAVGANTTLSLENITIETGPATITTDTGWSMGLDRALAAIRPAGPAENTYDIYADADALVLPDTLRQVLDPVDIHPAELARIVLKGTITLDRPIDRHMIAALETDPGRIQALKLDDLIVKWGEMSLRGDGDLLVDTDGIPTGRITIRAAKWRDMISVLVNAGAIQPGIAPTLENVAATMAGGTDTLDLPISFQDGFMLLGPIPLGPAPRF